jgi:hypothetical protein
MTSFDNLPLATLAVFQMFTKDGWDHIMHLIQAATHSNSQDFFFLFTVLIGSFFVVNIVTAVQFFYYKQLKSKLALTKAREDRILRNIKALRGEDDDEEKKSRIKRCWTKVKKLIWFKPNDTI